jgi:hypothetical protein
MPDEYNYSEIDKSFSNEVVGNDDFAKWQLWSDDILSGFEDILRNRKWDAQKGMYVNIGIPIMNEVGIQAIMNEVAPLINRNTFLSNVKEERIMQLMLWKSNRITELLGNNYEKYDLDIDHYFSLISIIQDVLEFTMRRPVDEGERIYQKTINRLAQTIIRKPEEKKTFTIFGKRGE